jgi:hypothetical protein
MNQSDTPIDDYKVASLKLQLTAARAEIERLKDYGRTKAKALINQTSERMKAAEQRDSLKKEAQEKVTQMAHHLCQVEQQRDRLAEALNAADECLSLVEDTGHGCLGENITVTRSIVIKALQSLNLTKQHYDT